LRPRRRGSTISAARRRRNKPVVVKLRRPVLRWRDREARRNGPRNGRWTPRSFRNFCDGGKRRAGSAFPAFSLRLKCRSLSAKTSAQGSRTVDKIPEKRRVVILRRGWQAVSASLAGNFLAAVDDVIVATGNSGPTTKRCSAGTEVHDHRPQMAVVLFAETMNLDFSCHGAQPLR